MKRGKKFNLAQFRKKRVEKQKMGKNLCKDTECKDDEICNPKTGKCVKRKTALGKRLVKITKGEKKDKKIAANMKVIKNKVKENKMVREFFDKIKNEDEEKVNKEFKKFGDAAEGGIFRQRLFNKILDTVPEDLYTDMITKFLERDMYLEEFLELYKEIPNVKKAIEQKKKEDAEKERRMDIIQKEEVEIIDPKIRPKRPRSSYLFFREYMINKLRDQDLNANELNDKISSEWSKIKKTGEVSIWEEKARVAREKYEKHLKAFNEARLVFQKIKFEKCWKRFWKKTIHLEILIMFLKKPLNNSVLVKRL